MEKVEIFKAEIVEMKEDYEKYQLGIDTVNMSEEELDEKVLISREIANLKKDGTHLTHKESVKDGIKQYILNDEDFSLAVVKSFLDEKGDYEKFRLGIENDDMNEEEIDDAFLISCEAFNHTRDGLYSTYKEAVKDNIRQYLFNNEDFSLRVIKSILDEKGK